MNQAPALRPLATILAEKTALPPISATDPRTSALVAASPFLPPPSANPTESEPARVVSNGTAPAKSEKAHPAFAAARLAHEYGLGGCEMNIIRHLLLHDVQGVDALHDAANELSMLAELRYGSDIEL